MLRTSIVALLGLCGPLAICRAITVIVSLAFQRKIGRWPLPHVGQEVVKRLPAFAYRNATCAVIFIFRVLRIAASLIHGLPRVIFGRSAHAMLSQPRSLYLAMQATTRNIRTIKTTPNDGFLVATVTTTKPVNHAVLFMKRHSGKSTEFLPSNVFEHWRIITCQSPFPAQAT